MTAEFLVTDTHPLVYYFCGNQKKLSKMAKGAFDRAMKSTTSIFVPASVLWEISMLVEAQKITLNQRFSDWVDELFLYPALIPVSLDFETVKFIDNLNFNDDPFDRAIVATALQYQLPLISNDSTIHKYKPCQLYWD